MLIRGGSFGCASIGPGSSSVRGAGRDTARTSSFVRSLSSLAFPFSLCLLKSSAVFIHQFVSFHSVRYVFCFARSHPPPSPRPGLVGGQLKDPHGDHAKVYSRVSPSGRRFDPHAAVARGFRSSTRGGRVCRCYQVQSVRSGDHGWVLDILRTLVSRPLLNAQWLCM